MSPNGEGDNYTRSRSNSWVSSTSLLIASTSTWPRKPRNWTTFQVPWESIEATCLGASIARRTVESRALGTSWTSSRSSSRARSARGLLWSVLLHRRGGQKAISFDTYLLQYRDLFARLDSFRVVYVTADQSMFPKAESIFSRLCGGPAEDRTACPSIRKSGDCWIMFHDRDLLARRQTASFDKRQLDQLSDELRESEGRSTRFCSAIGGSRARGLFSMQWTSEDDCLARSQPNC